MTTDNTPTKEEAQKAFDDFTRLIFNQCDDDSDKQCAAFLVRYQYLISKLLQSHIDAKPDDAELKSACATFFDSWHIGFQSAPLPDDRKEFSDLLFRFVKLWQTPSAPKQDDIAERLSAAEKLIAVFMEFRFLREDWKVKEALAAYEQRGGA